MIKKISFFLILFLILFAMLSWSLDALEIIDVSAALKEIANKTPLVRDYVITAEEISELEAENSELRSKVKEKETKINEFKEKVESLNQEISDREDIISNLEADYQSLAKDDSSREEKLLKITKIYADMEINAAASTIQELNSTDLAVEILSRLAEDKAASILEVMPKEEAAAFTSRLGSE